MSSKALNQEEASALIEMKRRPGSAPIDKSKLMTEAEMRQIKRLLNLDPRTPFPKCPGRSEKAWLKICKSGHAHKSLDPPQGKDSTCHKCACTRVAGWGTEHYGYGLCKIHEKTGKYRNQADKIAKEHLMALQQRHPRYLTGRRDYIAKVLEPASVTRENDFDLTPQMEKAKEICETLYKNVCSVDMHKEQYGKEALEELKAIRKLLEAADPEAPDVAWATLDKLLLKLVVPLTERGGSGPIEMSDATRYKLQMDLLNSLTQIAERVQKLKSINMITKESFLHWLGKYWQNLKSEFGSATYSKDGHPTSIIEGVGEAIAKSGEPTAGI